MTALEPTRCCPSGLASAEAQAVARRHAKTRRAVLGHYGVGPYLPDAAIQVWRRARGRPVISSTGLLRPDVAHRFGLDRPSSRRCFRSAREEHVDAVGADMGWTRSIMRRAMADVLPEEIRQRPGKGNLGPPFVRALASTDRAALEAVVARPGALGEFVAPAGIDADRRGMRVPGSSCGVPRWRLAGWPITVSATRRRHELTLTTAGPAVGAYGLRVSGIDAGRELLVDRATGRATYSGPRLPTPADSVHPVLTAAAAAMGRWSGYEHFHASAFVAHGRAWGLLGGKESGKSTIAAWLGEMGHPILCDDMLTMRARIAFAGPRCVDLRAEPARRLGIGDPVDTDGPRERWRVALASIEAEVPLGGWLFLEWGDATGVRTLGPGDVLRRLAASRTWRGVPGDPVALLDLAALPAWELSRPRSWASFEMASASVEAVIDGLPKA